MIPPMLGYTPFVNPMPLWNWWPILLIPLAGAVAIVYKSIKCQNMRDVPWQAFVISLWIVFGMAAAALVLVGLVRVREILHT
jgi:hypothetical protein